MFFAPYRKCIKNMTEYTFLSTIHHKLCLATKILFIFVVLLINIKPCFSKPKARIEIRFFFMNLL